MVCAMDELCTIEWAAERLRKSQRQVRRYITAGTLTALTPKTGSRESARHKVMLTVAEVEALHNARMAAGL
jgi:predicted DNA-binding protein (UPF0251 family)